MAKREALRTQIVTVKGMPVDAWEAAKSAALRSGEHMGEWLARAIRQLAERERGERVFPPGQSSQTAESAPPADRADLPTAAELAALMQAVAALSAATGVAVPPKTVRGFYLAAGRAKQGKLGSRSGQTPLQINGPEEIEAALS